MNINVDFGNYSIPMDQFDTVEISIVDEMFDRLNRNTKKLEQQELRHAKYDGWFISFAEYLSNDYQTLKDLKVVTIGRRKRMKDVQFISELIMVMLNKDIIGFSQDSINEFYAIYDSPDEELIDFNTETFEEEFKEVIEFIKKMNDYKQIVFNHASTVGQFYTLFSIIALIGKEKREELGIESISDKYDEFMNLYKTHAENNTSEDNRIIEYTKASTGASTEEPLRRTRLNTMNNFIFGSED